MLLSIGNEVDEKILFHLLEDLQSRSQSPSSSQTPQSPTHKQVKLTHKDLVQLISTANIEMLNHWIKIGRIEVKNDAQIINKGKNTFDRQKNNGREISQGIGKWGVENQNSFSPSSVLSISNPSQSETVMYSSTSSSPDSIFTFDRYNQNQNPSTALNSKNFREVVVSKNYLNPSNSTNFSSSRDYLSTNSNSLSSQSTAEYLSKNDNYNNISSSFQLHDNINIKGWSNLETDIKEKSEFDSLKDSSENNYNSKPKTKNFNKIRQGNLNTIEGHASLDSQMNSQSILETLNRSIQSLKKETKKLRKDKEELVESIQRTALSTRKRIHLYHYTLSFLVVIGCILYYNSRSMGKVIQDLRIQILNLYQQNQGEESTADIDLCNVCGYY